jgi:hypothetical protein
MMTCNHPYNDVIFFQYDVALAQSGTAAKAWVKTSTAEISIESASPIGGLLLNRFRASRREAIDFNLVVNVAFGVEIDCDGATTELLRSRDVIAVEVIVRNFFAIDFDFDSQLSHVPFSHMQETVIRRFEQCAGRTPRLFVMSPTDNSKYGVLTDPIKRSILSADEPKDREIANLVTNT